MYNLPALALPDGKGNFMLIQNTLLDSKNF